MKFEEFLKIYNQVSVIDSSTFDLYSENPHNLRRQVSEWVRKGHLIPLKRGIYIFNKNYRKMNPSCLFITNFLVTPSYLSMEFFFGFTKETDKEQEFFIALPEKAILDYFYLNYSYTGHFSEFDSLRLQNLEIIDKKRLKVFSQKYNKRVKKIATMLIEYINQYLDKYKTL
jgi:hypothetical protein